MIKSSKLVLPALFSTLLACTTPMSGSQSSSGASERSAAASATSSASSGASPSGAASGTQTAAPAVTTVPVVVLIPVELRSDPRLFNGCWVRLLDNVAKPKGGEELTIVGRMHLPSLTTTSGVDWKRKADGMLIGPNALVTAYGEEWYKGPGVVLKPGQMIQDLRKELGFVNSVESMKIECRS